MDEALDSIVPDNPNKAYNMKDVICHIVDDGDFLEVHEHWAQNIVVGFAPLKPAEFVVLKIQQMAGQLQA